MGFAGTRGPLGPWHSGAWDLFYRLAQHKRRKIVDIYLILLIVILPILITMVFVSVDSWLWRIIALALAAYGIFGNPFPGAPVVVPVALVIMIPIVKALKDAT